MRLIDADAFKKILSEHEMKHDKRRSFDDYACGASNAYEHASDLLDEMPTVERPHGEWIPCSERLPKHSEIVLVSFKTGMVQMCKYLDDGSPYSWWSYKDDCLAWNNTVDAWMPLPEPYKKEGDRNEQTTD